MTLVVLKPQIFCPDEPQGIIMYRVAGGNTDNSRSSKAPNILSK